MKMGVVISSNFENNGVDVDLCQIWRLWSCQKNSLWSSLITLPEALDGLIYEWNKGKRPPV